MTLTQARNVREVENSNDPNAPLTLVGRLSAGSEIEIPDEYCVFNAKNFDFDASVRKWLVALKDKAGSKPEFSKFDGNKHDYFIPVTVSKAKPGSKLKMDGKFIDSIPTNRSFYISIRDIAVSTDSSMKLAETSGIYGVASIAKAKTAATGREAVTADGCPNCTEQDIGLNQLRKHIQANAEAIDKAYPKKLPNNPPSVAVIAPITTSILGSSLETTGVPQVILQVAPVKRDLHSPPLLKLVDSQILKKFTDVDANMKRTCGFGLADFLPEIEKQVKFTAFSSAQLVSIMSHESSGVCFPKSRDIKDPMEHGLFGITNSDRKISQTEGFCGKKDGSDSRQGVRDATASNDAFARLSKYKTDPKVQCVGNPFLNLQASIRNLNAKLEDYQRRNPKSNILENGKLRPEGFKYIAELYAGQGMRAYGRKNGDAAVKLNLLINEHYKNQIDDDSPKS